jgi:hypothetical protein
VKPVIDAATAAAAIVVVVTVTVTAVDIFGKHVTRRR